MSTQFQVDTSRIKDGSGDIGRMSGEIESLVGSMTGRLKALEDSWKGSASTSFQEVLLEWKDTARQVRESLDSIGQVLGQVGDQYAEVEDANTRSFGRCLLYTSDAADE